MNRYIGSTGARTCRPRGFTLVELLVVILIIGILIGLLVPAVAAVRKVAKEASSKASLEAISQGLQMFKTDAKLGGLFPPSASDWLSGGVGSAPIVKSPYVTGNASFHITGAGLLVWAMSGADLLGTPGFAIFNPADATRTTWGQWTGKEYNNSNPSFSDAYALDGGGQPAHARYGRYVDTSKLKVTQNEGTVQQPNFIVPEERKILGTAVPIRDYPMYLDAFGYPILYWRADPAGKALADQYRGENNVQRGIYHYEDNRQLTDASASPNLSLTLNKAGEPHQLGWNAEFRTAAAGSNLTNLSFPRYIWNSATKARFEPQRADSFLLVSPGFDGRYGTDDDVTNFSPNGQ